MVFVQNVRLCEAEFGENIYDFATEAVEFRKTSVANLIVKFNDVYIEVHYNTTEEDIVNEYLKAIKCEEELK